MNRRDALKTGLAALLPAWSFVPQPVPRRVPLELFCDDIEGARWDLRKPFVQASPDERLFSFASDAKHCLRIESRDSDRGNDLGHVPPAGKCLPWNHDSMTGWKPWPKEAYQLADDSNCPACKGCGTADGEPGEDCFECSGFGCHKCQQTGIQAGWPMCPSCKGDAIGIFPGIQALGQSVYVESHRHQLIAKNLHGVEWCQVRTQRYAQPGVVLDVIAFRFEGGLGLLMPINSESAEYRIRQAKKWHATTR